ncbi:hypothetical protein PHLCEN_2v12902 [Hermanssonia centrifuga]|uniref:Uncharacterized protein n=1 Tax=Hermanssonia centrifuga TaxID=98765 RepID=A0A2R6NG62_9APHY|nr:hypothetical protein PHLCEN_2v12902 [Hermanssonia centrifuga]
MEEVHKAIEMLQALESWSHTAGRFLDLLCQLANAGDSPIPTNSTGSLKRRRDAESVDSAVRFPSPTSLLSQWDTSILNPNAFFEIPHAQPTGSQSLCPGTSANNHIPSSVLLSGSNELGDIPPRLNIQPSLNTQNVDPSRMSVARYNVPDLLEGISNDDLTSSFPSLGLPIELGLQEPVDDAALDMWSSVPTNPGEELQDLSTRIVSEDETENPKLRPVAKKRMTPPVKYQERSIFGTKQLRSLTSFNMIQDRKNSGQTSAIGTITAVNAPFFPLL